MSAHEVLIYVGLALVVAGAIAMFMPPPKGTPAAETAKSEGVDLDVAKILEELGKIMDRLDKRFRPGFVLMVVGLTIVCLGVFLQTKDVEEDVEDVQASAFVA